MGRLQKALQDNKGAKRAADAQRDVAAIADMLAPTVIQAVAAQMPAPEPSPPPKEDHTPALMASLMDRNQATLEVLNKLLEKDSTVVVDTKDIGKAVAGAIAKIPAPVVNIPPSKPRSYYATIDRDEEGEMIGALIEPQ